jgi:hypothetical protein
MKSLSSMGLVLVCALNASCSEGGTAPSNDPCLPETSQVTATVAVGSSIVFDWNPRCNVAMVLVEAEASDRWWISTPEESWTSPDAGNKITPPLTYGQIPAGITDSYGPDPLVVGETYELILWRVLPNGSTAQCQQRVDNMCLLAVHQFTR